MKNYSTFQAQPKQATGEDCCCLFSVDLFSYEGTDLRWMVVIFFPVVSRRCNTLFSSGSMGWWCEWVVTFASPSVPSGRSPEPVCLLQLELTACNKQGQVSKGLTQHPPVPRSRGRTSSSVHLILPGSGFRLFAAGPARKDGEGQISRLTIWLPVYEGSFEVCHSFSDKFCERCLTTFMRSCFCFFKALFLPGFGTLHYC